MMPCTECGIVKLHVCNVGLFSLCDVQYHVFLNNFKISVSTTKKKLLAEKFDVKAWIDSSLHM